MKWRLLAGVVALAAAGWSGWWFMAAAAHERALEAWLADRRAAGWQAEAAAIAVAGFPNRLDTRIEGLALADTRHGWAWSAPFVDLLMLSYAPNRAVLALPPEMTFAAPGEKATLRAERLRASARLVPGASLALSRVSVEGTALSLLGEAGWRAGASRVEAHVRQAAAGMTPPNGYDVYLALEDVLAPAAFRALVDPAGALPERAQLLRVDARAALDRPLDRFAVETAPPQLTALSLTALEATWGRLALRASGTVRADAAGFAEGRIDVRAENWREMLQAAVAAGAIGADLAGVLETGLGLLSRLTGDGRSLEAPLVFSGGRARLGPVPVGAAPRLADR